MEVDIDTLIKHLQSIIDEGHVNECQEWALIITIAHFEEMKEVEE